jgi:hypothetical protein
MNKNTKRKKVAAHKAGLDKHQPRRYKKAKVGYSAAEITKSVGRDRA